MISQLDELSSPLIRPPKPRDKEPVQAAFDMMRQDAQPAAVDDAGGGGTAFAGLDRDGGKVGAAAQKRSRLGLALLVFQRTDAIDQAPAWP